MRVGRRENMLLSKVMSTLLEPFIMIFLGIVIGTLVIAMYMPMLDMGQVILKGSGAGG